MIITQYIGNILCSTIPMFTQCFLQMEIIQALKVEFTAYRHKVTYNNTIILLIHLNCICLLITTTEILCNKTYKDKPTCDNSKYDVMNHGLVYSKFSHFQVSSNFMVTIEASNACQLSTYNTHRQKMCALTLKQGKPLSIVEQTIGNHFPP